MIDGRPALWCVRVAVLAAVLPIGAAAARASGHGQAARPGHPPRVGLVVVTRVNLSTAGADQLAAELAAALRARLAVEVVAGPVVRRLLGEDPPDDCAARAVCVRDVASRLRADQLLFLVVVKLGPLVKVEPTWVAARGAGPSGRPVIVIHQDRAGAGPAFAAASEDLLPRARLRGRGRAVSGAAVRRERAGALPAPAPAESHDPASGAPGTVTPGGAGHGGGKRHITVPVMIAAGTAGVSLALGAGLGLSARHRYSSLESDGCEQALCPNVSSRINQMEDEALAADILFTTSAVAGLTAVMLYLNSGSAGQTPPVDINTVPGGAVFSIGGHF